VKARPWVPGAGGGAGGSKTTRIRPLGTPNPPPSSFGRVVAGYRAADPNRAQGPRATMPGRGSGPSFGPSAPLAAARPRGLCRRLSRIMGIFAFFRILAVSRNAHSARNWPDKCVHKRRTERPDNIVVGLCFLFARYVPHQYRKPLLLTKNGSNKGRKLALRKGIPDLHRPL
jgi:hypothetical protein